MLQGNKKESSFWGTEETSRKSFDWQVERVEKIIIQSRDQPIKAL